MLIIYDMDLLGWVTKILQSHCMLFTDSNLFIKQCSPYKLNRHLKSKHVNCAEKKKNFFQCLFNQNKKQETIYEIDFYNLNKAEEARYHVARLIVRQKKTTTQKKHL